MVRATIFLVVTIFTVIYGAPAESEWDGRIVGGSNAATGAAKYQVSLRSSSNIHFCGGTILNSRTIATAAHCIVGRSTSNTTVVVGTNTLNSGGKFYAVSRLTAHPEYNSNLIINDVAVVITSEAIIYGDEVQPIGMYLAETVGNVSVTLTGWGTTSYPGSVTLHNNLKTITLKTITFAECKKALAQVNTVYETQLCTLTKPHEGACLGDDGGPLVAKGKLVGIVSWIYPCAKGYPDVYTRVSFFALWINSNAQS